MLKFSLGGEGGGGEGPSENWVTLGDTKCFARKGG